MQHVLALQDLPSNVQDSAVLGFSNLGSLISLYGSCSSSCVTTVRQPTQPSQ